MSLLSRLFPPNPTIAAIRARGSRTHYLAETLSRPDGAHPGECIGGFEPPRGDEVDLPAAFDGYRVERHAHGVVVYGPIPLADTSALAGAWEACGLDTADTRIAAKLGATLAVTSAEGSRLWREELGL